MPWAPSCASISSFPLKVRILLTKNSSPGSTFFFFNNRRGYRFLDVFETSYTSKWWLKYFYVRHPFGEWNLHRFFRRDKFRTVSMRNPRSWLKSLRPLTIILEKSHDEEGESDEDIEMDGIETRSYVDADHDTDPGSEMERSVVLGMNGNDLTLYYLYGS